MMEIYLDKYKVREMLVEFKQFEWEGDYRPVARQALKRLLEEQMNEWLDERLDELGNLEVEDRRNGYYPRQLQTEMGDIELEVPRTRRMSAQQLVKRFRRRPEHLDRMVLSCFVLGMSTRKVSRMVADALGSSISATTVSNIAKSLDHSVASYHQRRLMDRYRFLLFDGVVLKRRTGMGSKKRVVLVALGITQDNKKEVIDFRLAQGESFEAWEGFLRDLYERGLCGCPTELIITDGGRGLLSALEIVYHAIPRQRCWAHKTRNVLNYVRQADQSAVKSDLHKISHAPSLRHA